MFAVKDCVDLTITPAGGGDPFTIDFANECQLQLEADQLYAMKKGENFISFSSGRTGTFSITAECIDEQFLALMLGGKYDSVSGKIEVDGDIPSASYTAEGQFRVKTDAGAMETKKIKFYNLAPQIGADMTLSATDIGSFTLTFDVMANSAGKLFDVEKVSI